MEQNKKEKSFWETLGLSKCLELIVTVSLLWFCFYLVSSISVVKCDASDSTDPDANRASNSRLDSSAELVLGAFSEELDNAWFYETYYPVIIKIPLPDWSPQGHRLNQTAPLCESDKDSPNYMCPTQFHLDKLLTDFSENSRFFKNIYSENTDESVENNENNLFDENFSCLRIRQHFQHFATTLKDFETYLEALKSKCPLAKQITVTERSYSFQDLAQHAALKAYGKFTELHEAEHSRLSNETKYKKGDDTESNWKLSQMNGYTTLQNAFTLSTYIDSVRWSNAFSTCQGFRLDINLVSPDELNRIISEATQALFGLGQGYNISIPYDNLLSYYYKLPLVDCVLAFEAEAKAYLMLRILLPITRNFKHYKVVRLNKIPFFIRNPYNNSTNVSNKNPDVGNLCEIRNYNYEETFLVEYDTSEGYSDTPVITSVMKAPLTCGPYQVCRIPDVVHRSLVDYCVEGVLQKNEEITKDKCDFKCVSVSRKQAENDFPFIIQLTSSRFAVVGAMLNETNGRVISVNCLGRVRVPFVKQEYYDEATLITLPCHCELVMGTKRYFPHQPCVTRLEIIHVTHVLGDGTNGWKMLEGENRTRQLTESNNRHRPRMHPNKSNSTKKGGGQQEDGSSSEEILDDKELFNEASLEKAIKKEDAAEKLQQVDAIIATDTGFNGAHMFMWIIGMLIFLCNAVIMVSLFKTGLVDFDTFFMTRSSS